MKRHAAYLAAICIGLVCRTTSWAADIPRLGAVYYGQVLSSFGYPCTESDGVSLYASKPGGVEAAQYDVGSLVGPGINYNLNINVVATGSGVDGTSVAEGGTVQVNATVGGFATHLIGNTNIVVSSGAVVERDFTVGTDSNSNSIPDAWEQFVIDSMLAIGMTNGVTNLTLFNSSADYDGDGANNRDEFLSGTLPFFESDSLRIAQFGIATGGVFRVRFLGNQGFNYQIQSSSNVIGGLWQVKQVGAASTVPSGSTLVQGGGAWQDVYFPTNGLKQFYRLVIK